MALINKFAVASCVLLLVSSGCSAAQTRGESPTAAETPAQADEQSGTAQVTPVQEPIVPVPPAETATGQVQPQVPPQPPVPPTTAAPGQPAVAPPAVDPSTYVPKTEHDNTPWRFNMQQDGKSMSADAFEAWMKQRGVRVATGKPAVPLAQNCPTPEGDKGDSDGDGIINCLDQCPDSVAGQTIGPDGCPVPVSIDLQGVTFAYDRATLEAEAKSVLDEAVKILLRHPNLKVEVAGHTDSRGDAEYNQRLSERRAKAVYDYLVENGVDESRLIGPIGFGETRPLVPNQNPDGSDNPQGRAENRRTELNIQN